MSQLHLDLRELQWSQVQIPGCQGLLAMLGTQRPSGPFQELWSLLKGQNQRVTRPPLHQRTTGSVQGTRSPGGGGAGLGASQTCEARAEQSGADCNVSGLLDSEELRVPGLIPSLPQGQRYKETA